MARIGWYVLGSLLVGYGALQVLGRRAGSTVEERRTRMPGDELVAQPHILTNHAISIDARPADVWPWLTQMGWHLGGWYTPECVDRLLFSQNWPSLHHLDAALLRDLDVGDTIPDGPPDTAEFVVVEVDAPQTLVLHSTTHLPNAWREKFGVGIDWTWSFRLSELPGGRTRLHLRVRGRTAPPWLTATYLATIIPADFIMAGGMLRGIKNRAESGAVLRSYGRSPLHPKRGNSMTVRERILGLGMRRRFQARVDQLSLPTGLVDTAPVSEEDIAALPSPAQRYLRFMGVVGRPRDWSFRARFVGEFRQRPGQKFMACEAWQYNTSLVPARVYYMRIDFAGVLPMFGVDVYRAGQGRMHGKLLGLITVADGSGPEFDLSELTTYVNDALMFAPSMLLTPAVTWTAVDDYSFDVRMSDRRISATSRVFVDEQGRMVDFSTTDRWAALPGGMTRAPWTTPINGWSNHGGRWLPTGGHAIWHLDTGEFEYGHGRFVQESIEFNMPPGAVQS